MYELSVTYQQARHTLRGVLGVAMVTFVFAAAILAQSSSAEPNVVQPGAPGQPTRKLAADTRPVSPGRSPKDIEFMQGMIHHHSQAVEMVGLMADRTANLEIRRLGERIAASQESEMNLMRRWLAMRGAPTEMKMTGDASSHDEHHSTASAGMLMPGMLTKEQMAELKNAKGAEFDRLFLQGMIQHHRGALTMVKDLFASPGTGQDAELFGFASDVESGQIAEIKIMQTMLAGKP